MRDELKILRNAMHDRFHEDITFKELAYKYSIHESKIRRAFKKWISNPPEAQPQGPEDIHFLLQPPGRPCIFTKDEENTLAEAVRYFADNNTPLSKDGVQDLVQHYVTMMPVTRQEKISLANSRPSKQWVSSFMQRNNLEYRSLRIIDSRRVEAVTEQRVAEHIARVKSALDRYNIKDARFIFNMDQSGASFEKMTGRSLRKGVGERNTVLIHAGVRTKGSLERVTVMPIVSAAGIAYTPVIVFPGKQAHFRRCKGHVQTLHSFLPPCYLHQREVPGVNAEIIFNWAKNFIDETKELRKSRQNLLLIIDGYGAHVQFNVLQLFRDNGIIVIALPSHTSHVLQPLDVSVFSAYKTLLQKEIHAFARSKKVLDAFDIACCIRAAYSGALSPQNIASGFERTGLWDKTQLTASLEPLLYLFANRKKNTNAGHISFTQLFESFCRQGRSLLREADVEQDGTVRISTHNGAHITSEVVLNALKHREERRKNKLCQKEEDDRLAYKEPAADIRHLVELAPRRAILREKLKNSRKLRLAVRRRKTLAL